MNKRTLVTSSILGVGAIIATLFFLSSNPDKTEKNGESNKTQTSASTSSSERASTMAPGMSGMDHGETATEEDHGETATEEDHGEAPLTQRPLKATLGIFGFGTLSVLLGATLLRRKDRALAAAKKAARVGIGAKK